MSYGGASGGFVNGRAEATEIKISEWSLSSHSGGDTTMDRIAAWANGNQHGAY